jgi:hypothetical protein
MVINFNKTSRKLKKKNPLKKKIPSKRILKKDQASVTIKDYKAPDILSDPNRFFKEEFEETKRSLFM